MRVLVAAVTAACADDAAPARDQWVVSVTTDAPVPQLGDRLLVEVQGDGYDSRRVFGVGKNEDWPISFGIVARAGVPPPRVRARLFRAEISGPDGFPTPPSLIDMLVDLPPAHGRTAAKIGLALECFGLPADSSLGLTCDPATGQLAPVEIAGDTAVSTPGSAAAAQTVGCSGPAPADMVCVPGGLFLLGDPTAPALSLDSMTTPERLVRVSPFALDVAEMTVGQVRALVNAGDLSDEPATDTACTYLGAKVADNDAMPVNCVTRTLAEAACAALGKRLPSEAEWEFAAGNRDRETPFAWGTDPDVCAHSIVGRGRQGYAELELNEFSKCLAAGEPWGPVAGGHPADVTDLGIHDLSGNVGEIVSDSYGWYSDPCWTDGDAVLADPVCTQPHPGAAPKRSLRGGHWALVEYSARVTNRNASTDFASPYTGFRCAKSM